MAGGVGAESAFGGWGAGFPFLQLPGVCKVVVVGFLLLLPASRFIWYPGTLQKLSPEMRTCIHLSLYPSFPSNFSPLCLMPGRSKTNALNVSQKMIEMFVRTKHKIDKSHEFALVVVNNDVTWVVIRPYQIFLPCFSP